MYYLSLNNSKQPSPVRKQIAFEFNFNYKSK